MDVLIFLVYLHHMLGMYGVVDSQIFIGANIFSSSLSSTTMLMFRNLIC